MKKKGLIISTIVMVVVLIASLTTATYAWFNADAKASVQSISFSVGTASDVLIGVKTSNTMSDIGTVAGNAFMSGSGLTFAPATGQWADGQEGLGSSIDTGLDLSNMTKAVWTGVPAAFTYTSSAATEYSAGTQYYKTTGDNEYKLVASAEDFAAVIAGSPVAAGDNNTSIKNVYTRAKNTGTGVVDDSDAWGTSASVVKANGPTASVYDSETVELAIANGTTDDTIKGDYLDVCFGVQAANENVNGIYCLIKVAPQTGTYLGMNSAIHVRYLVDQVETGSPTWQDVDIYHNEHYGDTRATAATPGVENNKAIPSTFTSTLPQGYTFAPGDAALEIPVKVGTEGAVLPTNVIYQIHILIYIDGWDSDCNNAAGGVSSTISIDFTTTKANG